MKPFFLLLTLIVSMISNAQILGGYTDKTSYRAGDSIKFYLASSYPLFTDLYLDQIPGNYANGGQSITGILINNSIPASGYYSTGLNFQLSNSWKVPSLSAMPSSVYQTITHYPIPVVIKGDKTNIDVVIVYPTNTFNAYSSSGGKSTYPYSSSQGVISPTVSFNRFLLANNGDREYSDGFLKWINSSNRFGNNVVGFISDTDMEDYTEIEHAKLIIIIGHSEYWTRTARENFDKFVDSGKNALILSGNSMWWQARLQKDPININNPQMVCNKYYSSISNSSYPEKDNICDPLLETVNWNIKSLKYSVLGSIGSDWYLGQFNGKNEINYPFRSFGRSKVVLPNSPLFNNVNLTFYNGFNAYEIDVNLDNGAEVDGTLIKGLDINGDPILDKEALGFYRAEMIAYDKATYFEDDITHEPLMYPQNMPVPPYYTGIMVMQRTCSSGKIINVNNNEWCKYTQASGTPLDKQDISQLTQNFITELTSTNPNVFTTPIPNKFTITAAKNNVSYEACANGIINISPCGVTITDGYRVDHVNESFKASIINCSSCNREARYGNAGVTNNDAISSEKATELIVYPNPNTGKFMVKFTGPYADDVYELKVLDAIGRIVKYENNIVGDINKEISLDKNERGMYLVYITSKKGVKLTKKIIVE